MARWGRGCMEWMEWTESGVDDGGWSRGVKHPSRLSTLLATHDRRAVGPPRAPRSLAPWPRLGTPESSHPFVAPRESSHFVAPQRKTRGTKRRRRETRNRGGHPRPCRGGLSSSHCPLWVSLPLVSPLFPLSHSNTHHVLLPPQRQRPRHPPPALGAAFVRPAILATPGEAREARRGSRSALRRRSLLFLLHQPIVLLGTSLRQRRGSRPGPLRLPDLAERPAPIVRPVRRARCRPS